MVMNDKIDTLAVNAEENYLYTTKLAKYTELNQDLYLWVIQEVKLKALYYDTEGNGVSWTSKFVVEAKKIERATLPPLNLILQTFSIGYWKNSSSGENNNYTHMSFNFPSTTQNRKFSLKIGKVTDNEILTKIKNNDYNGIKELLSYAKNNKEVYLKKLTTTSTSYYTSEDTLFDGRSLLDNKAYYYIYVDFDDENGKYYPIEGVTLGQAWFASTTDSWELWAYTSSDFSWDNLSPTYTPSEKKTEDKDETDGKEDTEEKQETENMPEKLPKTGKNVIIIFAILTTSIMGIICYKKYYNYKDIK